MLPHAQPIGDGSHAHPAPDRRTIGVQHPQTATGRRSEWRNRSNSVLPWQRESGILMLEFGSFHRAGEHDHGGRGAHIHQP
jgi:hypothetical protein